MEIKEKIQSNIWKLYGYYFFHNFILAYVIERLYWEQRGMTIQHVVYTEIIYAVIIIILEIQIKLCSINSIKKTTMRTNASEMKI